MTIPLEGDSSDLVTLQMAYENSSSLLDLMKAKGWSKPDIAFQKIIVADFHAALEAAEIEYGVERVGE